MLKFSTDTKCIKSDKQIYDLSEAFAHIEDYDKNCNSCN